MNLQMTKDDIEGILFESLGDKIHGFLAPKEHIAEGYTAPVIGLRRISEGNKTYTVHELYSLDFSIMSFAFEKELYRDEDPEKLNTLKDTKTLNTLTQELLEIYESVQSIQPGQQPTNLLQLQIRVANIQQEISRINAAAI
jgi:hypothetical protein